MQKKRGLSLCCACGAGKQTRMGEGVVKCGVHLAVRMKMSIVLHAHFPGRPLADTTIGKTRVRFQSTTSCTMKCAWLLVRSVTAPYFKLLCDWRRNTKTSIRGPRLCADSVSRPFSLSAVTAAHGDVEMRDFGRNEPMKVTLGSAGLPPRRKTCFNRTPHQIHWLALG